MFYYRTTIQYAGTNYAGFQWQNGLITVQSEINRALSEIIPGKVTTRGASRTDTGVHALEQIVKITSENEVDCESFVNNFNKLLPDDIKSIDIVSCAGTFKPGVEAISKEYRYFFTNKNQIPNEDRKYIANISNELNLEAMRSCLQALLGKHDFCNFYSAGSNVKSTTRSISFCELAIVNPHEIFRAHNLFQIPKNLSECYQLRIVADGFLKQMIRHIVSSLWMVGSGKLSVDDFLKLLDSPKSEKQHWKVAPPNGLFLYRIKYN